MTRLLDYEVSHIPVTEIFKDDAFNCRDSFDAQSLETLAQSIRDAGLQTPITVMPIVGKAPYKYKIICGHRRFSACKLIRMKEIPAYIREMTDVDAAVLNLVENIERKNLNIIEEAKGLAAIYRQGPTIDEIARKTNLGRRYIDIRLKLLCLPHKIQDMAASGSISISDLKTIIAAYDVGKTEKELERIAENAVLIRNAQKEISNTALLSKKALEDMRGEDKISTKPKLISLAEVDSMLEIINREYMKVGINDSPAVQVLRWAVLGITSWELLSSIKQDLALLGSTFLIPPQYELEHNERKTKTCRSSDTGDDLSDAEDKS